VTSKQIAVQPEIHPSLSRSGYKTVADVFKAAKNNYWDSGTDNIYFRIPNNSEYLLGMPKRSHVWEKLVDHSPDEIFAGFMFEIANEYPGFQIGQTLLRAGDLRLHKRIYGFPHGVQRSRWEHNDEKTYQAYEPEAYKVYSNNLRTISKFSQKSYTSLAKFLKRLQLTSPPIYFDPGANNLIVDVQRKRFRMIDPSSETDVLVHHCKGNNVAGMTAALLDTAWVLTQKERHTGVAPIAETDKQLQLLRRSILKKSLLAGYDADLPYERNPFPIESAFYKSHDLIYAFLSAGMTELDCLKTMDAFNKPEGRKMIMKVFYKAGSLLR
jgi:hypothetical protein